MQVLGKKGSYSISTKTIHLQKDITILPRQNLRYQEQKKNHTLQTILIKHLTYCHILIG